MVRKTLLLLAALSATSGFHRQDFGRGLLRRTSHQHRRPISKIFASFTHPIKEKRTYPTENDVPAFKLERGAKKSGVASISSKDDHQTPSNTTPPFRLFATLLSLSIAAYFIGGFFFAATLSLEVLFVYVERISTTTTKSAPNTNSILRWLLSLHQRIHRVIRQFRALEKASTITPPPIKRTTSQITSSEANKVSVENHTTTSTTTTTNNTHVTSPLSLLSDHHVTHVPRPVGQKRSYSTEVGVDVPVFDVDVEIPSSTKGEDSRPVNPSPSLTTTVQHHLRPSSWFPLLNKPPSPPPQHEKNTHRDFVSTNSNPIIHHDEDDDDLQHSAMNQAMEIQAALDASSARWVIVFVQFCRHHNPHTP